MKRTGQSKRFILSSFFSALLIFMYGCSEPVIQVTGAVWKYDFPDSIFSRLALTDDNRIVVAGFLGNVQILSPDGKLIWGTKYDESKESFLIAPVTTPDGDILLLSESGHVFCLRKKGEAGYEEKWASVAYTRDVSTPLMVQDAGICVFYDRYNLLVRYDRETGKTLATREFPVTGNGTRSSLWFRAGSTALYLASRVVDSSKRPPEKRPFEITVMDSSLSTVKVLQFPDPADSGAAGLVPPYVLPPEDSSYMSSQYPIVNGDSLYFVSSEVGTDGKKTRCRFRVDPDGSMTKVSSFPGFPSGWLRDPGMAEYAFPSTFFENAEGRLLGLSTLNGSIASNLPEALLVNAGRPQGTMDALVTMETSVPQNGRLQMSGLYHCLWDKNGDLYFLAFVRNGQEAKETRLYRAKLGSAAPGKSTVKAEHLADLPQTFTMSSTTTLLLPDGKLVMGGRDGSMYCFQTDSPGLDPKAVRPTYHQTQSNGGRK